MNLCASKLGYQALNEKIRSTNDDVTIDDCYGERFIGCGAKSGSSRLMERRAMQWGISGRSNYYSKRKCPGCCRGHYE